MHTDVTTNYLGLHLRSPLVVGACPLTLNPETVRELTIAGAGAVVLPSLLQEQIVREMIAKGDQPTDSEQRVEEAGAAGREDSYNGGLDWYLNTIALLKHHTGVPIIASINGCTEGNWLKYAREIQERGADAIELSWQSDTSNASLGAAEVEATLVNAVETLSNAVSIPINVKLLPFFTSLPNLASGLAQAGASGVTLFGREPIWEIRSGAMTATSHWSLSDSDQMQTTLSGLIRLRTGGPAISVAASGGITTAKDVVHAVIAGASVAMVTSEVYRTGPDAIAHILEGIVQYLQREGIDSFDAFVASKNQNRPATQTRQSQVGPMIHTDDYRDPHPEPARQSGDRWGHSLPSSRGE